MALRYRLAALIRDPDPASRSLQVPLFPADGTVILSTSPCSGPRDRDLAQAPGKRQARGDMLAENAVMAQPGQSAANNIVGGGAPGGGADSDGLALARQSFKNVEVALGRYDLTSEG